MVIDPSQLLPVLVLSLACASISTTVTGMHIFEWLRVWAAHANPWLGRLLHCGYCFGHWVAFGLVIIYRHRMYVSNVWPIDYFLTALVIAWLSGIQWVIMSILIQRKESGHADS